MGVWHHLPKQQLAHVSAARVVCQCAPDLVRATAPLGAWVRTCGREGVRAWRRRCKRERWWGEPWRAVARGRARAASLGDRDASRDRAAARGGRRIVGRKLRMERGGADGRFARTPRLAPAGSPSERNGAAGVRFDGGRECRILLARRRGAAALGEVRARRRGVGSRVSVTLRAACRPRSQLRRLRRRFRAPSGHRAYARRARACATPKPPPGANRA